MRLCKNIYVYKPACDWMYNISGNWIKDVSEHVATFPFLFQPIRNIVLVQSKPGRQPQFIRNHRRIYIQE